MITICQVVFIVAYFSMLYGDTLTLIKQKITNIFVFESICSGGVMSEWGFVRVGFGPSGVMSSGVLSSGVMSDWTSQLDHALQMST